jgi:hypothetical protein
MKFPRFIWADYDREAPRCVAWAFYRTREDQRANRPDLQPIKLAVSLTKPSAKRRRNDFLRKTNV